MGDYKDDVNETKTDRILIKTKNLNIEYKWDEYLTKIKK